MDLSVYCAGAVHMELDWLLHRSQGGLYDFFGNCHLVCAERCISVESWPVCSFGTGVAHRRAAASTRLGETGNVASIAKFAAGTEILLWICVVAAASRFQTARYLSMSISE